MGRFFKHRWQAVQPLLASPATQFRLFPATSGPAAAVTFAGNFISGMVFCLSQGGCWFTGYWWWVASNGGTGPLKCALWSMTGTGAGVVVPGSVVTSGVLTANQWNFIPLPAPVPLSVSYSPGNTTLGSAYVAAIGVNGNFPDTNSQFNSGDVYAAGITSGPLIAYSGTTGSKKAPYGAAQGTFSTAGSDPSLILPLTPDSGGDGGSNFWVDVGISTVAPAGYAGSYRLWPNKYDANSATGLDSAFDYDICTEVALAVPCHLNAIWSYSPSGALSLPTRASAWRLPDGAQVATNAAPAWTLPAGGAAAAGQGWMYATFTGVTLAAGRYRVGVYNAGGTGGQWGATDNVSDYWAAAGAGGNGIVSGPVSAPAIASASLAFNYNAGMPGATPPYSDGTQRPGQSVFGQTPGGTDIFPQLVAGGVGGVSQNYWSDIEVTPV